LKDTEKKNRASGDDGRYLYNKIRRGRVGVQKDHPSLQLKKTSKLRGGGTAAGWVKRAEVGGDDLKKLPPVLEMVGCV